MTKILLSFPRCGNHLCRFFIELLSELPTRGCLGNKEDIPIYKNVFEEEIPFNIPEKFNIDDTYLKCHKMPNIMPSKLIFILRNPQEALLRNNGFERRFSDNGPGSFTHYFKLIDFYLNYKGEKQIIYYEDMINNKKEFINTLYDFLELDNLKKKEYVISNIEKLYKLSVGGSGFLNTTGGQGMTSNNDTNFHYKKIDSSIKTVFDNYIKDKMEKNPLLRDLLIKKYNIYN